MSELFPKEVSPAQPTSDVAVQLSREWSRNEAKGEAMSDTTQARVVSINWQSDEGMKWIHRFGADAYKRGLRDGAMVTLAVLLLAGAVIRIGLEIFAP